MNKIKNITQCLTLTFFTYFSLTQPAFAYVDPGSGSVIVTTILGLIAAIGYTVRKYYYNIKGMFRKNNESVDNVDHPENDLNDKIVVMDVKKILVRFETLLVVYI